MISSICKRFDRKWALLAAVKNTQDNVNGNILTTINSFVSAVDDVLVRDTRATRKPYPNLVKNMIHLLQPTLRIYSVIRGFIDRALLGKESLRSGVSIFILNADDTIQTGLLVVHIIEV